MTVVDTLTTRYLMDEKDYVRGANRVSTVTKQVASSQSGAMSVLKQQLPSLTGIVTALAAAGAAVVGVAGYAMKEAAEFDRMAATFAGAFGSMEAGIDTMKALESYASRSSFNLDVLAGSATQLAASGLSIARFLPLAEKFALVIGGTDPQGLEQVVGALARIKGGSFGEAMEVFRRAGVGANDLKAQGINITKGGEIQSSAESLFQAVEEIAKGRISDMAKSVEGSDAVTQSNLFDNIGIAVRELGAELNKDFLPVLTEITKGVKQFAQEGGFKALLSGMGAIGVTAGDVASSLRLAGSVFVGIASFVGTIATALSDNFAAIMEGRFGDIQTIFSVLPKAYNEAGQAIGRYENALTEELAKPFEKAPELPGTPPGVSEMVKPLEKIERNTQKTVDLQKQQYDLTRSVFGAGAAAQGINVEDLSDRRAGKRRSTRRNGDDIMKQIGVLIGELAYEARYAD